jgi:hypothetical protein
MVPQMLVSARRNHDSAALSNDFCNKIGPQLKPLNLHDISACWGTAETAALTLRGLLAAAWPLSLGLRCFQPIVFMAHFVEAMNDINSGEG